MQRALEDLPWVDQDKVEINDQKQVRLTITDMNQFDGGQLTAALKKEFADAKILKKGG